MSPTLLRILLSAAMLLSGWSLSAQATELKYDHRVAGDRSMTIQLGAMFPQVYQQFNGAIEPANLTVGGTLGIDLDFYTSDLFRLGGGLRGMAASSPNSQTLFIVPITFRAIWEPKWNHFSFPVGAGAGFAFTNFRTESAFNPVLMPTAGVYWNMTSSWSFGADTSAWIIFQPYFAGDKVPVSDSRIGYFVDFTLGTIYHF